MTMTTRLKEIGRCLLAASMMFLLPMAASAQAADEVDTTDVAGFGTEDGDHLFNVTKSLEIFNAAYAELENYYVDTLNAEKNIHNALRYMLYQLDPYTTFYPESDTDEVEQMTKGKYAGIGSVIGYQEKARRCTIEEPYEGKPAALAGLKPGDLIMEINGTDCGEAKPENTRAYSDSISALLRGEPGTTLTLRVKRYGVKKPLDFTITRSIITLPSVTLAKVYNDSIGYVFLNDYTEHTAAEVKESLTQLKSQGARRLILDLRSNPGGLVEQAAQILNLFLPKNKEVVRLKGRDASDTMPYILKSEPMDTLMPIVVMVDGSTASSAEITAGVLQDYDRGVILGQRTYGKGLVQQVHNLPYGSMIKLTTAKYYIPSGRCVQAYTYKDGEPQHLPDSLAHEFHTAAGRTVYDGGGIKPDVEAIPDSLPAFISDISTSQALSDYCAMYVAKHPTISDPAAFRLTAAEYAEFTDFIKESGFTYETHSKKLFDLLKSTAEAEGYDDVAKAEIDALGKKLAGNTDYDFKRWEEEIRDIVERRIVMAVCYQRGQIEYYLNDDKVFKKALSLLSDDAAYRRLLQPAQ